MLSIGVIAELQKRSLCSCVRQPYKWYRKHKINKPIATLGPSTLVMKKKLANWGNYTLWNGPRVIYANNKQSLYWVGLRDLRNKLIYNLQKKILVFHPKKMIKCTCLD